jgi:uncharacterized lipoprotein YehR (DUF1307 family)
MEEEIDILDEQRYNNEKLDYTQIIMRQILKISSIGSTELQSGGLITKDDGSKFFLPSSSEQFTNSVKRLEDLLTPYLDKEYKEKLSINYKDYVKKFNELKNKSNYEKEDFLKIELVFSRIKFRLLCNLMSRLDLLLSNAKNKEVIK